MVGTGTMASLAATPTHTIAATSTDIAQISQKGGASMAGTGSMASAIDTAGTAATSTATTQISQKAEASMEGTGSMASLAATATSPSTHTDAAHPFQRAGAYMVSAGAVASLTITYTTAATSTDTAQVDGVFQKKGENCRIPLKPPSLLTPLKPTKRLNRPARMTQQATIITGTTTGTLIVVEECSKEIKS